MAHHPQATASSASSSFGETTDPPNDTRDAVSRVVVPLSSPARAVEDLTEDRPHVPPSDTTEQSILDSPSGPAQTAHQVNGNVHELDSENSTSLIREGKKDAITDPPSQPEESLSVRSASTHRRWPSSRSPESSSERNEPQEPLADNPACDHDFSNIGTWVPSQDTDADHHAESDISV
jgi:hypothetical protein